ncbi:transport between ER and Golgi ATPase protein [Sporothrix curviconia]|uniref:Vesicular-fusion protein SEC18 n=1 Tax=Sporothrix curviconia TaxID=1260050 RepID=A0ABP0CB89_9PEZI
MDQRNALFGGRGLPRRPDAQGPPSRQFDRGPAPASPAGGPGYSRTGQQQGSAPPPPYGGYNDNARQAGPPRQHGVPLRLAKVEDKTLQQQYIFMDICAVSPYDFPPSRDGNDIYLRISHRQSSGDYVVTARPTPGFPSGCISFSDPQRSWMRVGLMDEVVADVYAPFATKSGTEGYLAFVDIDLKFASQKKVSEEGFDHDRIVALTRNMFANHFFSPGQRFLLDVQNIPLALTVLSVQLTDLDGQTFGPVITDTNARGIMLPKTSIKLVKNAGSSIRLTGTANRAANTEIFASNFNFEALGIGGLDNEFSTIFRRAFVSRTMPRELFDKLGIQHVKGVLLYGPPGTGKTLMAREIGKMLNTKEPKIINGPEVLNKYVGQSEENIRNIFADAEKEYAEKGDDSQLHLIIFDELDAVCKQRGSGASGGTGVGDSVVNQLLTKLDGVNPLNNILLIGMTNRKDMIDDALLRPGRLEVQVEIGLPNEQGRVQILKIHTAHMQANDVLADDVDLEELARLTPNFSGAELAGLVKSAASFSFDKGVKSATTRGVATTSSSKPSEKIKMADFENALSEVTAAYGASMGDLTQAMFGGIIHYSANIRNIINEIAIAAASVRSADGVGLLSMLLYGPRASGKKALAAHAALESKIPFVRIVTADDILGFASDVSKKDYVHKVFTDAYKSPLSLLILGNIERLIEWNATGARFNNNMVNALKTLVNKSPPKNHRLLIIGTTSSYDVLQLLGMAEDFNLHRAVPALSSLDELSVALREGDLFQGDSVKQIIDRVRDSTGSNHLSIGIKQVLNSARTAKDTSSPEEWFAEELSRRQYQ